MKWIKKFFVRQRIAKIKEKQYEKSKKSIEDIKSIHILATSYENLAIATETILSNWPNKIAVRGKYYGEQTEPGKEGLSQKDFSLMGSPKPTIQDFLKEQSDIFIVTLTQLDEFGRLIIKEKKAGYKIGFHSPEGRDLLDVMLAAEAASLKSNIENLLKYLKKII